MTKTHAERRRKTSLTKYLPLTLLQGFEKVVWGFTVRGSWRSNIYCNILTPHSYGRHVVSFLFAWCSTGGLGPTLVDAGFLYCILSASSLDPKLHRGSRGPPRPGVAFPSTSRRQLSGTLQATSLGLELNWVI